VSLGLVKLFFDWDFAGAESELDLAITLNPHYPVAYHFRALQSWCMHRRLGDALAILQRGLAIDPLSVPIRNMRAMILSQAGEHEQVLVEAGKFLELDPHHVWEYIGRAYERTGQPQKAIHWYLRWLEEDGVKPDTLETLRASSLTDGLPGFHRLHSELQIAQPNTLPLARHWQQGYQAQAFARLGKVEQDIETLEQAFRERAPIMVWLRADLRFELLRDHPRFIALTRRVGIPT